MKIYIIEEIKDLNFKQQHIEYKKYIEHIKREMLKGISKKYLNENKNKSL